MFLLVPDKFHRAVKRLCVCVREGDCTEDVCKVVYCMQMRPGLGKDEMVRWMYDVKVKDRAPSKELRDRLGIYVIISVLQQKRLR